MTYSNDKRKTRGQVAITREQKFSLTVIDDLVVRSVKKNSQRLAESGQLLASNLSLKVTTYHPPCQSFTSSLFSNSQSQRGKGLYSEQEIFYSSALSPDSTDSLYQTTSSLPPSELVYYYHHDHLGNIRAVTDQNGNVVERHDFYPFGEEITTQPQSKDQYLFTGKPRDSETGLDYFGARYYSPSLCRFLSVDPAPGYIADTRTLNPYLYAADNPLVYIDRDGEAVVIPIAAALLIGGGIGGLINGTAEALCEYTANPDISFGDLAKAFGAGFGGGAAGAVVGEWVGSKNPLLGIKLGQAVQSFVTQLLKERNIKKIDWAEVGIETAMAIPGGKFALATQPRAPGRPLDELLKRKFKNWQDFLKWLKKPGTKLYGKQQWHQNLITNAPSFTGRIIADTFWYYRQWDLYLWLLTMSTSSSVKPTVTTEVEINWIKTLGRAQGGN